MPCVLHLSDKKVEKISYQNCKQRKNRFFIVEISDKLFKEYIVVKLQSIEWLTKIGKRFYKHEKQNNIQELYDCIF